MRITQWHVTYYQGNAYNVVRDRETYADNQWSTASVGMWQGQFGTSPGHVWRRYELTNRQSEA